MKNFIVKITKILGVYSFLKKINIILQSKFGLGHGHNLFLFLIRKKIKQKNYKNFLEIGSTREKIYGQGSTEIIAKFCEKKKINFISVDADARNTVRLKEELISYKYCKLIHDKGENYLKNIDIKFDCIYLDAFDIEKPIKNKFRDEFYLKEYSSTITNEMSADIHLEITKYLSEKVNKSALIVFDDTFLNNNIFLGKGKKAIPFLINLGFKVTSSNSNSVALER
ncbi:hypothetical protein IDH08_01910 [Pelagibacterales bacterium SAG-MED22]|nr:hypothetical protein [Pelagibacterales bacterium SAG-MED22]